MSLTGLFLCSFLVVHLSGNFQLLKADGGESFNIYAKFMTTNPVVKTLSYGLYATFLLHIIQGLSLAFKNKAARPVAYKKSGGSANSGFASRNMALLGSLVLIFLVLHLANFWWKMKFGTMPMTEHNGESYKDLYKVVAEAFAQPWLVAVYVLGMVGLGFHLWHGFQSGFQTLGLNHKKYTPFITVFGQAFAVIIPFAFAVIPIMMLIQG